MKFRSLLLACAIAALPQIAYARMPTRPTRRSKRPNRRPRSLRPPLSVTRHTGRFGGQTISYKATAGETYLKDKDGKPLAAIYSTSYVKDGKVDPKRPVIFLFNGGPGSGSLWLHMGAFGPKRVAIPSDARDDGAPPYPIVDNPESLLDVTDLVFIDPVGTGFVARWARRTPRIIGASPRCRSRSPSSSACGWRRMAAGTRPSSSAAKAMAPPARRRVAERAGGHL